MPEWIFERVSPAQVELEPTQRDQFNNDEVGLADALVRESIQNSTDARAGQERVKVRFSLVDLDATETLQLREMLESLRPHLVACGLSPAPIDTSAARLLVVEDFNTTGLTGAIDSLDKGHFRNFWRRHGGSEKTGKSLGRWGLGKLVYSSSSRVHAFFGLTCRAGDKAPLLFGQAVLLNHDVGKVRHPAHGFWFADRGPDGIQLPVSDHDITAAFTRLASLDRGHFPGLSIVIPYPLESLTEAALLSGVVQNYYFPILAGRLEVEIGETVLNKDTFLAAATPVAGDTPLDFVANVSKRLFQVPPITLPKPIGDAGVTEEHLAPELLKQLRDAFAAGELIQVRAPLNLKRANGTGETSHVELFLQEPPDTNQSYALFVRGSLTVTGERRYFSGVPAYGAMIASHEPIAEFLGDAENPAHTSWNGNAEKVVAKWRSPHSVLRPIRAALRTLYQLVGGEVPHVHENLLLDFFSLVDSIPSKGSKTKKPPVPKPVITPREPSLSINRRTDGFSITAGPAAASWTFPKVLRIRAAYDLAQGNPFKRHSKYDFDIGKNIAIESKSADVIAVSAHVLRVTLHSPDFVVSASGFDVNRDLVVEARTS
jgi:hypothetical protein